MATDLIHLPPSIFITYQNWLQPTRTTYLTQTQHTARGCGTLTSNRRTKKPKKMTRGRFELLQRILPMLWAPHGRRGLTLARFVGGSFDLLKRLEVTWMSIGETVLDSTNHYLLLAQLLAASRPHPLRFLTLYCFRAEISWLGKGFGSNFISSYQTLIMTTTVPLSTPPLLSFLSGLTICHHVG